MSDGASLMLGNKKTTIKFIFFDRRSSVSIRLLRNLEGGVCFAYPCYVRCLSVFNSAAVSEKNTYLVDGNDRDDDKTAVVPN